MLSMMRTEIPLSPQYEDADIRLGETAATIILRLMGGADTAMCEAAVGVHKATGAMITARAKFAYQTDLLRKRLNICGTMSLPGLWSELTLLCEGGAIATVRLYSGMLADSPLLAALRKTLAGAQEVICAAASKSDLEVASRCDSGIYADKYFALQNGMISHILDPNSEEMDVWETVPVGSFFSNVVTLRVGSHFCNVIGSTHDPKPSTGDKEIQKWMDFWSYHTSATNKFDERPPCCCYSNNTTAAHQSGVPRVNGHRCNASAIQPKKSFSGNHSLRVPISKGAFVMPNQRVPKSAAETDKLTPPMYIIPSCANSNHTNGVFRVQTKGIKAVEIQGYKH